MPTMEIDRGVTRRASHLAAQWLGRLVSPPDVGAAPSVSVVIPTTGAGDIARLLESLAVACRGSTPEISVVDARECREHDLVLPDALSPRVVSSSTSDKSDAGNAGMRSAATEWVVVLDDDLVVGSTWYDDLLLDLAGAGRTAAGVAARVGGAVTGPLRGGADVAYRRLVALSLGGFQSRFPRAACPADVELAQRMARSGWVISTGNRCCSAVPVAARTTVRS